MSHCFFVFFYFYNLCLRGQFQFSLSNIYFSALPLKLFQFREKVVFSRAHRHLPLSNTNFKNDKENPVNNIVCFRLWSFGHPGSSQPGSVHCPGQQIFEKGNYLATTGRGKIIDIRKDFEAYSQLRETMWAKCNHTNALCPSDGESTNQCVFSIN